MKTNLKKKELITVVELEEARKLFYKIKKLKEQLSDTKKSFGALEMEVLKKVDKNAEVEEGGPMFIVKEWSRKIVAWEAELERLCGKEVVDEIKTKAEPRYYRGLEFGD